jgi:hypothetical protein
MVEAPTTARFLLVSGLRSAPSWAHLADSVACSRAPRAEERCDPRLRCDLLPAFTLDIDARARLAVRPIDVLFAVAVEASALPSKMRLKVLPTLFSALPSKVLSKAEPTEAAARGEGSPRVEEAPAGACFERFRNLALDAL